MVDEGRGGRAWLTTAAIAGLLMAGCWPAHDTAQDGGGSGEAGEHGGSAGASGHDAGAAGMQEDKDACADAVGPDDGGAGGTGGSPCTNACSTGATRCASSSSLETCTLGVNGCTSFVASPCGIGTVCERTSPAACVDPQWAEWPISSSSNDVANGAPNLEALVDNLDGTVTDKVTGLMWDQRYYQSVYATGDEFCATVMTGGYTDWRQATLIELVSIADFSRDRPTIDTSVFPLAGEAGFFWTSTRAQDYGLSPYIIDYGTLPAIEISGGFGVDGQPGVNIRCVR